MSVHKTDFSVIEHFLNVRAVEVELLSWTGKHPLPVSSLNYVRLELSYWKYETV